MGSMTPTAPMAHMNPIMSIPPPTCVSSQLGHSASIP